MSDVAALGLSVDSSQVVSATAALESMGNTATRTQTRVSAITAASDSLVTALNRNSSATDALTAKILAFEASGGKAAGTMGRVAQVTDTATSNVIKFTGAANTAKTQLDAIAVAADKATAAWAKLGAAGAAQSAKLTPQGMADFRLSSLSSVGQVPTARPGATPAPANRNGRLNAFQAQNLFYQGTDVIASAASGISPMTIALQQGGQIAPTFMGKDAPSFSGVASQVSEGVMGLARRIGLMGGAVGAATLAVGAAIAAQMSYAETQRNIFRQTSVGIARASGATPAQLNAIAAQVSSVGGISTREARSGAGELSATGRISPEMIGKLAASAKDYAASTGSELPDAFGALAAAFADPTKGADSLNKQLGFLNDTTRENIQRLDAQGNRLGAQRMLFDAYNQSLTKSSELTTGWGRVTGAAANIVSEAWDKVGQGVDKLFTGGTLEDRLADAERVAARRKQVGGYIPLVGDRLGNSLDSEIKDLRAQVKARDDRSKATAQFQRSLEVDAIVKSNNPATEGLKRLEDQAKNIYTYFKDAGMEPFGGAKAAMDGLNASAKQLREDMAAGGAQYADGIRAAQFGVKTAGFDPTAKSAATIDETAANARLAALRDAQKDTDNNNYEKALASIETKRQLDQQALAKETTISAGNQGGAFSRAPGNIQIMILDASKATGLSPDIIAAIGERENNFGLTGATKVINPKTGRPATTAYGYGQITDGAEEDIRKVIPGYDKYDPATAVLGAATYAKQRIDRAGNTIAGLDGYGTGAGYGVDILRRAGKMGDASQEGVAKDLDAATRAAKNAGEAARINAEYYGRNGLALEANTRASEQYQQMLARGVPASDALRQSLLGLETAAQAAARATKLVQFSSDDEFAREQLGRDRGDQAAYAAARGRFGDTSSPEALEVIRRTRETGNLTEAKQLITDGATSFVSEFRRTGDAAKALSNAFAGAADKLLSKALDGAISGGFSALLGSGGGGGFKGIDVGLDFLSFATGGYTGHGGKYDPAGVVHRGEYVFDAASTNRIGVGALEAIRAGLPGYAAGGLVGGMPTNNSVSSSNDNSLKIGQINMQGSSGDPATDDAYLDKVMGKLREEASNVFEQKQAASLRPNGSLWKAGVRRAS